jgi:hypothetical protein
MGDAVITLPVQAVMSKQPDGSYKMISSECVTVQTDAVARWLLSAMHVPDQEGGR